MGLPLIAKCSTPVARAFASDSHVCLCSALLRFLHRHRHAPRPNSTCDLQRAAGHRHGFAITTSRVFLCSSSPLLPPCLVITFSGGCQCCNSLCPRVPLDARLWWWWRWAPREAFNLVGSSSPLTAMITVIIDMGGLSIASRWHGHGLHSESVDGGIIFKRATELLRSSERDILPSHLTRSGDGSCPAASARAPHRQRFCEWP